MCFSATRSSSTLTHSALWAAMSLYVLPFSTASLSSASQCEVNKLSARGYFQTTASSSAHSALCLI